MGGNKVIFLDIDGVLNSNFWNDSHQVEISDGKLIDSEKVKLLAKLIEATEAEIILHSGWRFWFDEKVKPLRYEASYLESVLVTHGLRISGITPDLSDDEIKRTKKFSKVKASEILLWLKDNPQVDSWLVLDDLDLHNEVIAKHQIMTDSSEGITEEDVAKAISILQV